MFGSRWRISGPAALQLIRKLSCFSLEQPLGLGQPLPDHFQIIIAAGKLDQQLAELDEMFHLVAYRTAPSAAHLIQLRPLLLRNAKVDL